MDSKFLRSRIEIKAPVGNGKTIVYENLNIGKTTFKNIGLEKHEHKK